MKSISFKIDVPVWKCHKILLEYFKNNKEIFRHLNDDIFPGWFKNKDVIYKVISEDVGFTTSCNRETITVPVSKLLQLQNLNNTKTKWKKVE